MKLYKYLILIILFLLVSAPAWGWTGKVLRAGIFARGNLLPISLGSASVVFEGTHGSFWGFWITVQSFHNGNTLTTHSSFNERTDLSFGDGYRTILNENTLLDVNGFFDTTKMSSRWYSSGSVGFEVAALLPGIDAIDGNFNRYDNLFKNNDVGNAFRRGPSNYDFKAGYSHEPYNRGPGLLFNVTGHRFSPGAAAYGLKCGTELKTRHRMLSVKYEASDDRIKSPYYIVGGFVNEGLQLESLVVGKSPFIMPQPIFRSPRSRSRTLSHTVLPLWFMSLSNNDSEAGGILPAPVTICFETGSRAFGAYDSCGGLCAHLVYWSEFARLYDDLLTVFRRIPSNGLCFWFGYGCHRCRTCFDKWEVMIIASAGKIVRPIRHWKAAESTIGLQRED